MRDDQEEDGERSEGLQLTGPLRLACANVACWRCKISTEAVALCAANVDDLDESEEPCSSEGPSFIHDIGEEDMPADLAAALAKAASQYRPIYSRTLDESIWGNVCSHCGALQGGFFMHSEPDGPFFGGPAEFEGEWRDLQAKGATLASGSYSM